MKEYIGVKAVCEILGISLSTIYRRLASGTLQEAFRTTGGHRRFKYQDILNINNPVNEVTAIYSRVSSNDQKDDLVRQAEKLIKHCEISYPNSNIIDIRDLGSGLNFKKKGLNQLISLIINKKITRLLINHKDRLLRFGSLLIFNLCKHYGVSVQIIEEAVKGFE